MSFIYESLITEELVAFSQPHATLGERISSRNKNPKEFK